MIIDLPTLEATDELGRRLGAVLFPGSIVALDGPLGAGKTQLVRAIAAGLGVDPPHAVASPTFALIHEYDARLPIFHFDAYRLRGTEEFLDLGVHEYFDSDGICLVEWAERVAPALPPERLAIELAILGPRERRAMLRPLGKRYQALARRLTDRNQSGSD
jgi:tRNA threonylcarbamoyladenosine biosynthesis protein TsaE